MSNECPFKNMQTKSSRIDPKKIAKFPKEALIEEVIKEIPLRFEENNFVEVIQLALLLPSKHEMEEILQGSVAIFNLDMSGIKTAHAQNLYDTIIAIRNSHSLLIKEDLYKQQVSVIEDLAKLSLHIKEGKEYWEKELLNALLEDKNLRFIETWDKNIDSIQKLIELFHLPAEKLLELCRDAINKGKEKKPSACISVAEKMGISIYPKEYQEIADKIIEEANKDEDKHSRRKKVSEACSVFETLGEYGDSDNKEILREYKKHGSQKAIKKASKIIPFKYIGRFWNNFWGSCC